jgi:NhaC family Na+:H+ antiporter
VLLIALLGINVAYISGDDALGGSNQLILISAAFFAFLLAYRKGTTWDQAAEGITQNISSTATALFILLLIGSLAAIWTFSGIVPAMIYYGLQLIHPQVFLPLSALICALVSIAIGSSWSTTATVGIALIGMGNALGIQPAWVAGAIVSGAYFGDKISPLSDTTNLAAAVAGVPLFTHIKYMFYTTLPSFGITLILFTLMGFRDGCVNPLFLSLQIRS